MRPGGSERNDLDVRVSAGDTNTVVPRAAGTTIPLSANATNKKAASDASAKQTNYRWNISCAPEQDSDSFINITDVLNDTTYTDITKPLGTVRDVGNHRVIEGSGLSTLNVPTENIPDECFGPDGNGFLKALVTVNEPGSQAYETNFGKGSILIPITKNPSLIKAYNTTVTADRATKGVEICTEDQPADHALCRTVRGEVLALEVPELDENVQDVQWSVNGKPVYCNTNIAECAPNNSIVYYPVTEHIGAFLDVVATTNNPSKPRDTQTITRNFRVSDPTIRIVPSDGANKKVYGEYLDTTGERTSDESSYTFEATAGESLTLTAEITPTFTQDLIQKEWIVDGASYGDGESISFAPTKKLTSVILRARLSVPLESRTFFEQKFGISQFQTSPRPLETRATIIATPPQLTAQTPSSRVFASIAQNTPGYILFLFKMVLIIGLMLITPTILLRLATTSKK